jgi:phage gp29-like protein
MAKRPVLYGPDNQPIDMEAMRRPIAAPEVIGIRQVLSSHPAIGVSPQRIAELLLSAEQGNEEGYLELAEDMEERDLHYLGVLGTRRRSVSQLDLTVEAAGDDRDNERNADLVRDVIGNLDMEDIGFDLLDSIGKGFAVSEMIWDTSDIWAPTEIVYRLPRWFTFDKVDGTTLLLRGLGEDTRLPPFKFVQHRAKAKSGVPIRGGLARAACWAWMFKNFSLKDWVVFLELYGQPLRVGRYPANATEEEKRGLLRAIASMGTDAGCIIPEGMSIEFNRGGGGATGDRAYLEFCNYIDQQVSKAVLGQTATTDAIAGGHAVGKEHRQVQEDIERADARQLARSLNRDLVKPVVDLNHGPQARYPKICIGRPEAEDIKQTVEAVARLVPLGLKVEQSVMRDKLRIPEPADGAELLTPPARRPAERDAPPDEEAIVPPRSEAAAARGIDSDDAIDEGVAAILEEEGWTPDVSSLEEALTKATSLEEATEIIADHLGRIGLEQLAEKIARARLGAHLAGQAGLPKS